MQPTVAEEKQKKVITYFIENPTSTMEMIAAATKISKSSCQRYLTMPEYSNQKLKIDSINREKSNTKLIKYKLNSVDAVITLDYDNNDNILRFNGYTDGLYYKDENGKIKGFRIYEYETATDLIEGLKKYLDYNNIEYTIEEK